MEQAVVSAISHDTSEVKVTITGVPDRPGVAARVFREVANHGINVDMIVQNTSTHGLTDISFTVPKDDMKAALEVMKTVGHEIGAQDAYADSDIGRVSLIGAGMKSHPGVTATMFETLAKEGINIEMISTSAIRISCVVRQEDVEKAVKALHEAFEL